jgi:hypothetical protein
MRSKTALAMALAVGLTAAGASAEDLYLHVKVHDAKEDSHVNINLPLSVVEKSSAFLPSQARGSGRIRIDDEDLSVAELRGIWTELQRHPDATWISVDEPGSKVRVSKRGGYLHILAHDRKGRYDRGENVEIKIPASVVRAMLSSTRGDEFDIAGAIRALAREGEGELVTVTGDNETVRIWIDARSESR